MDRAGSGDLQDEGVGVRRRKLLPIKSLEKKLDRLTSELVRRRDADEGGTVRCVTCNKLMHWRESQCGHWVKRQHRGTRWHLRNVAPQCAGCNMFKSGAMDEFALYLLNRYGQETIEELMRLKHTPTKHTRADLEAMIEETQGKIAMLEGA